MGGEGKGEAGREEEEVVDGNEECWIIIITIIIIYKTYIAPMLEFRALYSYVNRKKKDKND